MNNIDYVTFWYDYEYGVKNYTRYESYDILFDYSRVNKKMIYCSKIREYIFGDDILNMLSYLHNKIVNVECVNSHDDDCLFGIEIRKIFRNKIIDDILNGN